MSVLFQRVDGLVGAKSAAALAEHRGIRTVEDLLRFYPLKYSRHGQLTDLSTLMVDDYVTVIARVERVTAKPMKNRKGKMIQVTLTDGRGTITANFFNSEYLEYKMERGAWGMFSGKVTQFNRAKQLGHPQFQLFGTEKDSIDPAKVAGWQLVIPVYPSVGDVPSWRISKIMDMVIPVLDSVVDPVPAGWLTSESLVDLPTALRWIHRPETFEQIAAAEARLRFDEALEIQMVLARRAARRKKLTALPRSGTKDGLLSLFDASSPFELTAGQRRVGDEIVEDLAREYPMNRLLQGDVGSGKTLVALRAMLTAIDAGGQAALLAPTEVLAVQHHRSLSAMLGPLGRAGMLDGDDRGTRVGLITGSQSAAKRREEVEAALNGTSGIVVGTHALLEDTVQFADLALVVVDEQHRFGVEQRFSLTTKSKYDLQAHALVMTATPIPRTVALTAFGDLDVSVLDDAPPGRAGVTSFVVAAQEKPAHLARVWERVREEVAKGHRVYVVCSRIGDEAPTKVKDEGPKTQSVIELAQQLSTQDLAGLRVGMMYGSMSAEDKDDVMRRFSDPGHVDPIEVLVSTTVIEVGVDVPTASLMVVMDSERFGVSQLHQLRGRVGRSSIPGLALFVTQSRTGAAGRERVEMVASTTDGFALAEFDLATRREGDVLGTLQSGRESSLRFLKVLQDADIMQRTRVLADGLVLVDPELTDFPLLGAWADERERAERRSYLDKA